MKPKDTIHGKFANLSGMDMKQGRMINNMPDPVVPLTQMAIMRKEQKRREKIDMMAQAYMQAEMMSDLNKRMMGGED